MNPYGISDEDSKVFTIPVTGAVRLYEPEMRLIATREFQRLARIKQLGTAHVVFRGAVHSRFEHSLGTVAQAERIVAAVNRNPRGHGSIEPRPHRLARLAALLHDVAHIPFGHTLEDELGLLTRHDKNTGRIARLLWGGELGATLKAIVPSDERDELNAILSSSADEEIAGLPHPFVADIVGNTVCADMLDYVQRDLFMCGMPGLLGDRFLDFFSLTPATALARADRRRMALRLDRRGMPRPDVESEVLKLLTYRYELVERVYFHHAKNGASVMLGRAVVSAGLVGNGDAPPDGDAAFDYLSDDLLLEALTEPKIQEALALNARAVSDEARALAAELARAIRDRRLYKMRYLGVLDDLEHKADDLWDQYKKPMQRRELEAELAAAGQLPDGYALVHVPPRDGLLKGAKVRVLTQDDDVLALEEWDERHSGRAGSLIDAHRRLWRVAVYVHPDASPEQCALVRARAEDIFGAPNRYVRRVHSTAYLNELFDQHADEEGWSVSDRRYLAQVAAYENAVGPTETLELMRGLIAGGRRADAKGASDEGQPSAMGKDGRDDRPS